MLTYPLLPFATDLLFVKSHFHKSQRSACCCYYKIIRINLRNYIIHFCSSLHLLYFFYKFNICNNQQNCKNILVSANCFLTRHYFHTYFLPIVTSVLNRFSRILHRKIFNNANSWHNPVVIFFLFTLIHLLKYPTIL